MREPGAPLWARLGAKSAPLGPPGSQERPAGQEGSGGHRAQMTYHAPPPAWPASPAGPVQTAQHPRPRAGRRADRQEAAAADSSRPQTRGLLGHRSRTPPEPGPPGSRRSPSGRSLRLLEPPWACPPHPPERDRHSLQSRRQQPSSVRAVVTGATGALLHQMVDRCLGQTMQQAISPGQAVRGSE